MILVTLGTQKQPFTRLLEQIERSKIEEEIIVQAGHTRFESEKMQIFDFIDYGEMEKLIEKADLIITHGGTGSIVGALKKRKKVIACARLKKYGEHVDDHQKQIVNTFSEVGYILRLEENENLDHLVKRIKDQKMEIFHSNTENFIKQLKEIIG